MHSYSISSIFFAPSAFSGTFATKTTKRATTRDFLDRNIPDAFDVVYGTYGRDGCSMNAGHRCLPDIQMRSHPQYIMLGVDTTTTEKYEERYERRRR